MNSRHSYLVTAVLLLSFWLEFFELVSLEIENLRRLRLNLIHKIRSLDQLDLDETVEKVKQELFDDNGDLEPVGLVQALASGAEVAPSEGGKYPHKSESIKPIKIPKVHFEVRKTAIDRHRLGQMSPFIYQLLTKGKIFIVHN